MKLKLTAEERYVLAAALAAYISLGTVDPESDKPMEAVWILHAMGARRKENGLDEMALPVRADRRIVIIAALSHAVTFFKLYPKGITAAVLSLVFKIGDQRLTEEVHDYYAGEW